MSHPLILALLACGLIGLRHGFDYDHLAAISDIACAERRWSEGMGLGLLYALGHASTVAALGAAVLFLHLPLPSGLDAVGERLVGATLIVLALYVAFSFLRQQEALRTADGKQPNQLARSRIALLISAARYGYWRVRRLADPARPEPTPFAFVYTRSSVFAVGMVHGLGAETPSQLLIFLIAANLGGTSRGFLGLLCFLAGMLLMNTLMTAFASGVFSSSLHRPRVQGVLTTLTTAYSLGIGVVFLLGADQHLPPLH
jgi:high-affinity nickel-transport protein